MRNILSDIRDGSKVMRTRARTKFKKKEKFLVGKYGLKDDGRTKGLDKVDMNKYGNVKIFDKLGLSWAKLSSSWDWTLIKFDIHLVSLYLIW